MTLADILSTAITTIFLVVILSYYILLFVKHRPRKGIKTYSGITIIVPAHNEERYIKDCINSILDADFPGEKQIIVIDDGSKDGTADIIKDFHNKVTFIEQVHSGKSKSLNKGLKLAKHDLVAVIDGDSVIHKDSLVKMLPYIAHAEVAVVCPAVKVKNKKTFIGMWVHMEQLYNTLLRELFTKTNANIVAPGPLSLYKKKALEEVGGFSYKGYSEDVDIAVRLLRAGYRIEFCIRSVTETNMPVDVKGFFRQRTRFAKGWINIFKRHMKVDKSIIRLYTLPLMLFGYLQAVIMGLITLINLSSGYWNYFLSKGIYMDWAVLKFFFEWFSILGISRWALDIFTGAVPLTFATAVGLASALLTYPLYLFAILRLDGFPKWYHIIPLLFMFPFWFVIMIIYIINLPESLHNNQRNIWKK